MSRLSRFSTGVTPPPPVAGYAAAEIGTHNQWWNPGSTLWDPTLGYVPLSTGRLDGMVLHELLHNLGYTDGDLQASLMGNSGISGITDNISQVLTENCFSK